MRHIRSFVAWAVGWVTFWIALVITNGMLPVACERGDRWAATLLGTQEESRG